MTQVVTHITIDRSVDAVFDYVTTPANWPQWHPSSVGVDAKTAKSLDVGEQVREDIKVGWQRDHVVWTVTARERPRRWVIEERGEQGGSAVLEYRLDRDGDATRFTRNLNYQTPPSVPAIFDRLIVRHLMKAASRKALARLKQVLETKD